MKLINKKTGEVGKLHCDMNVSPTKYGVFEDTDIRGHYWEYDSLSELNADWEDYNPAEPLIKDEKIRKAVRAWVEANDYGNDEVYEFEDFWTSWRSWSLEHRGDDNEIHFNGGIDFDKMNHRGTYTIAELCGEEE